MSETYAQVIRKDGEAEQTNNKANVINCWHLGILDEGFLGTHYTFF